MSERFKYDASPGEDTSHFTYGDWEFYFGYEETVPPNPPGDSDDYEWAFVVRYKGKEQARYAKSEIDPQDKLECWEGLYAGMAKFIADNEEYQQTVDRDE